MPWKSSTVHLSSLWLSLILWPASITWPNTTLRSSHSSPKPSKISGLMLPELFCSAVTPPPKKTGIYEYYCFFSLRSISHSLPPPSTSLPLTPLPPTLYIYILCCNTQLVYYYYYYYIVWDTFNKITKKNSL